jgi:hypothetical protein
MENEAKFNQVIPFNDPALVARIHFNFRAQVRV